MKAPDSIEKPALIRAHVGSSSPLGIPDTLLLAQVNRTQKGQRLEGLRVLLPQHLPEISYEKMTDSAYVMRIGQAGHHGTIDVESDGIQGAKFTVDLPLFIEE
ncbi:MAG: hypothetical protein H7222_03775 [Methylotenera sp.]|nr:hypothetical protein [Oligoflexia bacterium]